MDKIYNNKEVEEKIYQQWEERGYFKADPTSDKKPYSLLMPPPNLTGELHLGHAMQHAIMDALARYKRMQGLDVLLLPGVDHAGIQFEATLDRLLSKEGLTKSKLGREKWLERAWQFKDEVYKSVHNTWKVFGLSADWSREVFMLEPKIQQAVAEEFRRFWEDDSIYKGAYIVQWCPKDQTAIEDLEMEYQERKEKLYYVKYLIEEEATQGNAGFITVATARPETIFADVAIAVYPNHPKYKKYVGKTAWNPLGSKENALMIKIIEDKRVDKEFGTGALKITPGHDPLDYQIGKDNDLPILHAIDKTGRMTSLAGDLQGLKIDEARKLAAEKLESLHAIEKVEDYTHSVPVCERCKATVEPLISEEWFVKMSQLGEKALTNIKKIDFAPKNYEKIISDWLKEIHDWCISRSLWWGHRIPVWYCQKCNSSHQVGKDKGMAVSLEEPTQQCKKCGANDWVQEEQVLDAWFSSGMWPITTLGWPEKTEDLARYYPWDFEITAPEIKYLWIARMIMLGLWFNDKIPFKNMFFHGMIRDSQGRKFSKSLGNGIDPNQLREQWGTDAVRMALYTYAIPGRDAFVSRQLLDERCKNFRNFSTKLKNIARFIFELKPEGANKKSKPPSGDDIEIMDKLGAMISRVNRGLNNFELHLAADDVYSFVWHELADKYIEQSKKRREEAQPILEDVFKQCLILLHPFMPFITEEIYQTLPDHKESIMLENWPQQLGTIK
jgi:valyl-tRNA synthetase